MLKRLSALSIGVGLSLTGSLRAQEHNHPAMNSVGRFFGIGWSHGYHAGVLDGRFQREKDNHPTNIYGSSALLYPYQNGYEPYRTFTLANQGYVQSVSGIGESQSFPSAQQNTLNQPTPTLAPVIPPKPVEPPPTWLRPFLKDDAKRGLEQPKQESREEVEAEEASPSDLLKPKTSPSEPTKKVPTKASDDDDLLTLSPLKTPLQRYHEARRNQVSNR